jgi:hypothetical protein
MNESVGRRLNAKKNFVAIWAPINTQTQKGEQSQFCEKDARSKMSR